MDSSGGGWGDNSRDWRDRLCWLMCATSPVATCWLHSMARVGSRYILGYCNMTLREILHLERK